LDEPDVEDEADEREAEVEDAHLSVPTSPVPSHDLSAAQREEEMESKNQAARALVEERRGMLESQELQRRQKEQTQKRQQRHDRHKKKRAGSVEKSNRGPGSESEDEKLQTSDSDHSFVESSEEENPFELCYSPDKTKPTSTFRDVSGYYKPDITGYQSQEKDDRKVRIEDNYKGAQPWEAGQGGVTSCWSGVVSQLCGSSTHIWLNLPLVSMFAYDPVPDAET
jgi:TolA-binding protein